MVIAAAHPLEGIADFGRVVVMDQGRAVEVDDARKLLEKGGVAV